MWSPWVNLLGDPVASLEREVFHHLASSQIPLSCLCGHSPSSRNGLRYLIYSNGLYTQWMFREVNDRIYYHCFHFTLIKLAGVLQFLLSGHPWTRLHASHKMTVFIIYIIHVYSHVIYMYIHSLLFVLHVSVQKRHKLNATNVWSL